VGEHGAGLCRVGGEGARSGGFRTIHALVSRARRSVKRCDAEPGPLWA
jgi:hypothetical protein